MRNPVVIGLIGEVGAGKSTLAAELAKLIPGSSIVAFADRLKQECREAFGLPATSAIFDTRETKNTPLDELSLQNCVDQEFVFYTFGSIAHQSAYTHGLGEFKKAPFSPRVIMQRYSDFKKAVTGHSDYYIYHFQEAIDCDRPLIVPDVRYETEAALLANCFKNSVLAYIHREKNPFIENRPRHASDKIPVHKADLTFSVAGKELSELVKVAEQIVEYQAQHKNNK